MHTLQRNVYPLIPLAYANAQLLLRVMVCHKQNGRPILTRVCLYVFGRRASVGQHRA